MGRGRGGRSSPFSFGSGASMLRSVPSLPPPRLDGELPVKVINRSSKYKNRYIHRRDSLSLASLSLDDRDKLARIGVVTRASGDLPEGDEDEDDDDDGEEEELEELEEEAGGGGGSSGGGGGARGRVKYAGDDGAEDEAVGSGSGKVRTGTGEETEGVDGWGLGVVLRLVLPSWTPGTE